MGEDIRLLNIEFFRQFDTDADGCVSIDELRAAIRTDENGRHLPQHVVDAIFNKSDVNNDGKISFEEFEAMIQKPENDVAFGSTKNRFLRMRNFVLPPMPRKLNAAPEELSLSDQCSLCPPPITMLFIALVQIALFFVDFLDGYDNTDQFGPIARVLIYDPEKREEAWRYLTYMLVHLGSNHLITNMVIQIILGSLLETVHRGHRILAVYLAGVVLGSLWNSIIDPTAKLAGASGGVYSLVTAHIATIIINWTEMKFPIVQLLILSFIVSYDLGASIYERYMAKTATGIGIGAHLFGALAGLFVGIRVLRNIKVTAAERIIRNVTMVLYFALLLVAIGVNAFYPEHFRAKGFVTNVGD